MNNMELHIPKDFFNSEMRCGFRVSSDTKKVWAIELDLLSKVDSVCKKYDIQYYAFAGTLLGAIRHKGFIPWDNDIDLMMDRTNYIQFCRVAKNEFSYPYFLQTEDTDPGSRRGHAQVRNSSTTAILNSEYRKGLTFNQGVFIDIFPLDNIPDGKLERNRWLKHMWHLKNCYERWQMITDRYIYESSIKGIVLWLLHEVVSLFDSHVHFADRAYMRFEKGMVKYNCKKTRNLAPLTLRDRKWIINRCDIEESKIVPFEMLQISVPKKADEILLQIYGNWKEFVIGTDCHGSIIFDTEKPYTEYLL